jgi:hypothetical protein
VYNRYYDAAIVLFITHRKSYMTKLTFEQFKELAESNAQNDEWLFGEGWDIIRSYPEYCDRMIVESFKAKMEAAE